MNSGYWEIKEYLDSITKGLSLVLRRLDDDCFNARKDAVPIYLTKGRIKTLNSLYLKTKRKSEPYNEITDIGGFRILCLFEKDIPLVHVFLLKLFKKKSFYLKGCKIYNWDEDSEFYAELNKQLKEINGIIDIDHQIRKSGYRSIHYNIEKRYREKVFKIEVQLRTIVQDVWGEIEHEIAYKKASVRPYVKQSVRILAKDLQNIDDLFSHLRDISDKEKSGELYSNYKQGPKHILDYEKDVIDDVFCDDELKLLHDKYISYLKKYNRDSISKSWISQIKCMQSEIYDKIKKRSSQKWVKYWINMEDAFVSFCESKYGDAISKYEKIEKKYYDRYCVFFRIGEIYSLSGDIVTSLAYFDKVEKLIKLYGKSDYLNQYRIKTRLAMVYWSLGGGFIGCAIEKINDAKEVYEKYKSTGCFGEEDYYTLINNICYYYLEKYLVEKDDALDEVKAKNLFAEADQKYEKLSNILKNRNISRNLMDTASWFLYNKYLITKDKKFLEEAKALCLKMREYENKTVYSIKSLNLQKDHIQEIMCAAEDVLKLRKKKNYKVSKNY